MSTPVLDPPDTALTTPATDIPFTRTMIKVAEKPASTQKTKPNWLARQIVKAYMSSLNVCLRELGWVPTSILEVGFGDASLTRYVAQTFPNAQVVGVETHPELVEAAKQNNCCSIKWHLLTGSENLPFESNTFDLVICHQFLGQTPTPISCLAEMTRVSAEGVIVSTLNPNGKHWLERLPGAGQVQFLGHPLFDQDHIHPLPATATAQWLNRLGCPVELKLNPLPFTMVMARKPQPQKQT